MAHILFRLGATITRVMVLGIFISLISSPYAVLAQNSDNIDIVNLSILL